MGEPLFGEPWGKPGLISGVDPEEPSGPSGDEMFDEFPGLPEVGGHHGSDHFAAAEGTQASEPGNVAVAANDGECADPGEIGEQPFAIGAEGKSVEGYDSREVGVCSRLRSADAAMSPARP